MILLAIVSALAGPAAKPAGTPFPAATSIAVEDGTNIAASWGWPAAGQNAVVLVHMNGRNREDWSATADKLARSGVGVVALDLRKHGANPGAGGEITPQDYADMVKDVRAAVKFAEEKGAKRLILVGAELGANLAINVATEAPNVVGVALLSPGMEYRGVIASDAVKRYGSRPLLIVVSNEDAYAAKSSVALDGLAQGEHQLHVIENAGKGTKMLSREPALEGFLTGWIATHWAAPAAAPKKSAVPTIKVETKETVTTGPTSIPVPDELQ